MRINIFAKIKAAPKTKTLATIGYAALSFVITACSANVESNKTADDKGGFAATDIASHTVTFDRQPGRVMLDEGRIMFVTAMLDQENPGDHIATMGNNLRSGALSFETRLFGADPELEDLPTIDNAAKGNITMENLISHGPDVVVMTFDHEKAARESGFLTKLGQAGPKYVFTDFRQKPLESTVKSVRLLDQIVDEQDNTKKFTDFYTKRVNEITERVTKLEGKPRTFVWRAVGLRDCCSIVNESNLSDLVIAAGDENLGDSLPGTESGNVTAEKVLSVQSEKIIITGGPWASSPKRPEIPLYVELGYTAIPGTIQHILEDLLKAPDFDTLTAPRKGDLYAAFHQFYGLPYNVSALEQLAKWIHPEEFVDLDPVVDFAEFYKDCLPPELSGTFFTALKPTK